MVGLVHRSFNMGPFQRQQALTEEGYDPNDPKLSVGQENQATIQMLLKWNIGTRQKLRHVGTATVAHPRHVSPLKYLSYQCKSCKEFTPAFRYPTGMRSKPFNDALALMITCIGCENSYEAKANEYKNMSFLD